MTGKENEIRAELRKLLEEKRAENEALTKLIIALHEKEIGISTVDDLPGEAIHEESENHIIINQQKQQP